MRSQKQCPFIHLGRHFFLVMLLFIFFMSLVSMPFLTWGQGRSLGFRGLVPPAKAQKKLFKGEVILIDLPLIKIKNRIWGSSKVFVGPPSFLNEQGFHIRRGQRLVIWAVPMKVEGNEILAAFRIEDMDTGQKVLLRRENGEPIWWGGDTRGSKRPNDRPNEKRQKNQPY